MQNKIFLFKTVIAFVLLYYLHYNNYLSFEFIYYFKNKSVIISLIILSLVVIFIAAVRWWISLQILGFNLNFAQIFKITYIGTFFNTFLFGAYGGDLLRLFYITGSSKKKIKISSSILLDRIFGLLAILLIIFYFLIHLLSIEKILFFYNLYFDQLLFLFIVFFTTLIMTLIILNIFFKNLKNNFYSFLKNMKKQKQKVIMCVFLSLLIFFLVNLAVYLISVNFFNDNLKIEHIFFANSLSQLANAMPFTPGGIGIGELVFTKTYEIIQSEINVSNFANIIIFFRIINIIASIPGLIFFLFIKKRNFST